ncbi:MAG: J domain-containing protein [Myxococcales bacterium]|nr:J domain-containing protein [Myxococcales bacterium]
MSAHEHIAGLGPKTTKPQLNTAADLRTLRLSPTEGFVLSRVDGYTSYGDICNLTGLGAPATLDILKKLKAVGVIFNPGEVPIVPSPIPAPAPPPPAPEPPARGRKPTAPPDSVLARLDDGSPVDPVALEEGPDLDELVKMRLLRVSRRLPSLAPHELLGVPADADAKTLKKAYFAASKELHPDRFFGKNLGTFRSLLERLFRAISEAFETLEKKHG